MTDITSQDRRAARAWAKNWQGDLDADTSAAARVILATVDAPAPTLAEEMRGLASEYEEDGEPDPSVDLYRLADRVEQIEQERDEARDEANALDEELAGAESEVERLTEALKQLSERVTARLAMPPGDIPGTALPINVMTVAPDQQANMQGILACSLPDPADVKPGEAWIVECRGERRNAVKDRDDIQPWNTVNAGGWLLTEDDGDITIVSRLVPEPRTVRYEPKEK